MVGSFYIVLSVLFSANVVFSTPMGAPRAVASSECMSRSGLYKLLLLITYSQIDPLLPATAIVHLVTGSPLPSQTAPLGAAPSTQRWVAQLTSASAATG